MTTPTREGETIAKGRYTLRRSLGRGTFGDVYLAESLDVSATGGTRDVVIKILHPQWAQVVEVVERFRRESMVTQKIEHPHVARIFEHGQVDDGVPFIAMEYLPGRSLRDQLQKGALPQPQALGILIAIAEALGAAHRAGVVHRDLKPDNIQLIERNGDFNYPVVLDFGVAKFLDAAERLTMTGALLGTPAYMSPEQFRGESNLGPPADVYALGVLSYEMIAGSLPFSGSTFAEMAVAHTALQPSPLTGVSKHLTELVMRCLDKDPTKRPRAEQIAQSMRGILTGAPVSQLADTRVDPYAVTGKLGAAVQASIQQNAAELAEQQRRQRTLTLMLALAVFLVTSAAGLLVYFFLF